MVAASKLQNCKSRLENARTFFAETEKIMNNVNPCEELIDNIYLWPGEADAAAYLVVTSNRGMCGSYNTNLLESVHRHIGESGKKEKLLTIGTKGYEYYRRNGNDVVHNFDDMLETAFYIDAVRISHFLRNLFSSGEVSEVHVAYTEFESAFTHTPKIKRILPVEVGTAFVNEIRPMKYDAGASLYLDHAIPAYLNTFIYMALLESIACENAARMLNMDAAVDNATDIIENLTRAYNRKRQTSVTQEISEIVSGVNALGGLSGRVSMPARNGFGD